MKQLHDTQIGWQLLTRNLDKVTILTADKGYDWWMFRQKLRAEDVKPVIKYREFGCTGVANNVLIDEMTYHQRSNIESTFFALRRKYGEIVRARTWFGQFREDVVPGGHPGRSPPLLRSFQMLPSSFHLLVP